MVGSLPDVITYAKFRVEIFRGYDFTGGVEFPIFLLIFEWALQQCSATALPVTVLSCPVLFFSGTRPGRTAEPIFTLYGSNDVFSPKEVPFGG